MNKVTKIITSSFMAAAMLASLAGCGGKDEGSTSTPTTEPTMAAETDAGAQATNTPNPGNVSMGVEVTPRPRTTLAPEPENYGSGEDRVVLSIPVGDGSDEILYYPYIPSDLPDGSGDDAGMSEYGADDFCYFNGDFYVLDTLDNQIIRFDGDIGYFDCAYNLPEGNSLGCFSSFAVDENNFYLLSGSDKFYVVNRDTGESKRIVTLSYDWARLMEKGFQGKLCIRDGKVIIITDYIVMLYDPNGEEQKLVETKDYGFMSESTKKVHAYRNKETGEACRFTEDALREISSAKIIDTYGNDLVFMPDGSIIIGFFERYEDNNYDILNVDQRVIRISKDGEVVAMSDILNSHIPSDYKTSCRIPQNAIEVIDGHVYYMIQFADRLEIREVAMHSVD